MTSELCFCVSGVPQLVLLTKVDEACPLVAEDLKNVYQSHYINRMVRFVCFGLVFPSASLFTRANIVSCQMQEVSARLGVSLSAVVPVKNYSKELDIDPQIDILLLNAVIQMLRAAEGYFDDLYNVEESA